VASFGSFLLDRPVPSTRTRDDELLGEEITKPGSGLDRPDSFSKWCCPLDELLSLCTP
jgi:hypothetical protein